MLSYVHPLFEAEHWQTYIHTLRWQERPLHCPRCQSQDGDPWGTYPYRPGGKRSWCNGCQRTLNERTNPLLHQSRRSGVSGMLATFLWCLSCASRRIARELGGQSRTRDRWGGWLRQTAVAYETERRVTGTVAADALSHTAGSQGPAPGGGKKAVGRRARGRRKKRAPGRGHADKARPALIAWGSRHGPGVSHAPRACTVQTVQKAAD